MTGYVRQSAADIVPGNDILAAPLNLEFNQLQTAFNASTGHNHQGGTGQGPKLVLTGSAAVSGILPPVNGGTGAALTTTVDNTIPRFNGTGGILQTSNIVITDADGLIIPGTFAQINGAGDAALFIGRKDGNASTPSVAFNSGATATVYDSIIFATGGTGSDGFGALTYTAGAGHTFNGLVTGANGFSGLGTLLTGLNASNIDNGTLPPPRIISSNGFPARTGSSTWAARTIVGSGDISVTNGDGVAGNPTISVSIPAFFASGTRLLFQQTAAPTGWTKVVDTGYDNRALRVVTGAVVNGGEIIFTSVFNAGSKVPTGTISSVAAGGDVGATALSAAQIPGHSHTFSANTGTVSADHTHAVSAAVSVAAGGSHGHTMANGASPMTSTGGTHTVGTGAGTQPTVTASSIAAGGSHSHSASFSTSTGGISANHTHAVSGTTSAVGSGGTHDHTFTGTAHSHTFTGNALNFNVAYIDVTICVKD